MGLDALYAAGPSGRANRKLEADMMWSTWFAIAPLRAAKARALRSAWRRPLWTAEALARLFAGRARSGYAAAPPVVHSIVVGERLTGILGDLHMANLVGNETRVAFVDFSEAGDGSPALDLAPLWCEWWLAHGLFHADDGFLGGFRRLWRRFVGTESWLVDLSREFGRRVFRWLLFAFYSDHLDLPRQRAVALATRAQRLITSRTREAITLDDLLEARS
jgi:hypothetical protein